MTPNNLIPITPENMKKKIEQAGRPVEFKYGCYDVDASILTEEISVTPCGRVYYTQKTNKPGRVEIQRVYLPSKFLNEYSLYETPDSLSISLDLNIINMQPQQPLTSIITSQNFLLEENQYLFSNNPDDNALYKTFIDMPTFVDCTFSYLIPNPDRPLIQINDETITFQQVMTKFKNCIFIVSFRSLDQNENPPCQEKNEVIELYGRALSANFDRLNDMTGGKLNNYL